MKKILFTVALFMVASVGFAQKDVVKQAKKLKNNPEQALKVLQPALTNPETAGDPETWKLAGDLEKSIYSEENTKMFLPNMKDQVDVKKLYGSLLEMFKYYLKCDEVEQTGVKEGTLKKAKIAKKIANDAQIQQIRLNLLNGGAECFNTQDYAGALAFLGMYVDLADSHLYRNIDAVTNDTLVTQCAMNAAQAATFAKDAKSVIKYGEIGKKDPKDGHVALQCMAMAYGNPESAVADSTKWMEVIDEGVQNFPAAQFFIASKVDYLNAHGRFEESIKAIDDMIAREKTAFFIYVKGQILLNMEKYDMCRATADDLLAYNADKEKKEFLPEAYYLKAASYYFPGQKLLEEASTMSSEDPAYEGKVEEVKEYYRKAAPIFEKVREIAPDNKQLWGQFLYSIYYILGDSRLDEISAELGY